MTAIKESISSFKLYNPYKRKFSEKTHTSEENNEKENVGGNHKNADEEIDKSDI